MPARIATGVFVSEAVDPLCANSSPPMGYTKIVQIFGVVKAVATLFVFVYKGSKELNSKIDEWRTLKESFEDDQSVLNDQARIYELNKDWLKETRRKTRIYRTTVEHVVIGSMHYLTRCEMRCATLQPALRHSTEP